MKSDNIDMIKMVLVAGVKQNSPVMMKTAIQSLADLIDEEHPGISEEDKEQLVAPIMADVINTVRKMNQ